MPADTEKPKQLSSVVQDARVLRIKPQQIYQAFHNHKLKTKGLTPRQVLDKVTEFGLRVPPSAQRRLADLAPAVRTEKPRARAGNKRGNGQEDEQAMGVRHEVVRRLHLVLVGLESLEVEARQRIASGNYTLNDLKVCRTFKLAQMGKVESVSQSEAPDEPAG